MQKDLKDIRKVYIIGIGGIGVSAIARFFKNRGASVSGSDRNSSKVTESLESLDINVHIGDSSQDIPQDCDCVIYTAACGDDHPQLVESRKRNIFTINYSQALGLISKGFETIAISGTHGKTTTTAMTAQVLIDANLSPTVIVGSLMKGLDGKETNFIKGDSKYFIAEADEYKKSFLSLYPKILAITNIDLDHLDFYRDIEDIKEAFLELAKRIPKDGYLICDKSSKNLEDIIKKVNCDVIDYKGIDVPHNMKVPGSHNRDNAKIAIAIANIFGVDKKDIDNTIVNFEGVWRRFEYKGDMPSGAKLYDDYAHNPQKVRALLSGAREYFGKEKKIIAVFQPHLFSRTKTLLNEFGESFSDADMIILAPIYHAREVFDPSISSKDLAIKILQKGKTVKNLDSLEEIASFLKNNTGPEDVVITIGAGDINKISQYLLQ